MLYSRQAPSAKCKAQSPMSTPNEAQQFILHWAAVELNERAVAQSHFIALCKLLGLSSPVEADPKGQFFRFEKPLTKAGGKAGFADVWYKDRFAIEYKTKGKYATLREAYLQLLLYKDDLDNPPILIACDLAHYEIHVAFTGYPSRVHRFTNADLANASVRDLLRQALTNPEVLRPVEQAVTITKTVAASFAKVAQLLEARMFAPTAIAHFFMQVLFALFAEDIQLLPAELMSKSIRRAILNPGEFPERARALFRAMREGGYFGEERVPRFNGWLFDNDEVLPLSADELTFLADAARHDWAAVEPAIFGTLFERSLDATKRAQLGAHYTSREDILLIVEPVLLHPLRRTWAEVKAGCEALRVQWEQTTGNAQRKLQSVAEGMLLDFMEKLAQVRVLDPACGSGNFLYVALTALKDLEKEVWTYAGGVGLRQPELGVTPAQLFGIEKNPFAAELAQVVVWIGYLQWLKTNGFLEGWPHEPVLKTLHTIENRDAILTVDLHGHPAEPPWPAADVIIGNPPFLGDKKMRGELGDIYVERLRKLYAGRVPGGADLVTYWFERARAQLEQTQAQRVGLLATNSIRSGASRRVLERIKQTGNIFMAWADRQWILDGAAVRVSIIGFDAGIEQEKVLDGRSVERINPDLSVATNVTNAVQLRENAALCFLGMMKGGSFDIDEETAIQMLAVPLNPNGRPNSDVVRPRLGGQDITGRPRSGFVIDFVEMTLEESSLYEIPFEYVRRVVKPVRDTVQDARMHTKWWLHGRSRPALRAAIEGKQRCIVTPEVAKHRLFVWMDTTVVPDHTCHVIARDDDYFFGMLHAKAHELWSLRMGNYMGIGNDPRYNSSKTFETYPFPWPPGSVVQDHRLVVAIAEAARSLVQQRDAWLNSPVADDATRKQRTLTNLYNQRPDWLSAAHHTLDAAVFAAYGWPHDLSDEEVLARLLGLNLARGA